MPLGYVSRQLGHADVGVTVRHYARYVSDEYREPPRLAPGEIPADLLARVVCTQTDPTRAEIVGEEALSVREPWWSQRESNPCLQGENPKKPPEKPSKRR